MEIQDFISFLQDSPTSWHCVQEVASRLEQHGFIRLKEAMPFDLKKGGKYVVIRGGSIAAFCLPEKPKELLLLGAHTDSPALKLKPNPLASQNGIDTLSVESYGAPLIHSWTNRDLVIAGRYCTEDSCEHLVFLKELPILIPELAIHLNRDVNEKGIMFNKQEHLMPLLSLTEPGEPFSLNSLLGNTPIISSDLLLVPVDPPRLLGVKQEWLGAYRLDNLVSVHAATRALISYQDSPLLPFCLFTDHEEIGSRSWEGAGSTFLQDVFCRISEFYEWTREQELILKQNSLCISLDVAHGLNPLYTQKYDPNHQALLGKGPVLKHNADLRYACSAPAIARIKKIASRKNLPLQNFASRSDIPCGSTIGPIIANNFGIQTVDIGCAQLSMHSAREVIAISDYEDLILFLQEALIP